MIRARVAVFVPTYPSVVETYMQTELEAVSKHFDVHVIARARAEERFTDHLPYRVCAREEELVEAIQDLRPHVLHTHWMHTARVVAAASARTGVPFTVRSHSFDTLARVRRTGLAGIRKRRGVPKRLTDAVRAVQGDGCLGVLAFPFAEPILRELGVPADRLHVVPPVINVGRFRDRGPNGDGVLNTGPCLPKKQMEDFVDVAKRFDDRPFRLYAVGDDVQEIEEYNRREGSPAIVMPPVEPAAMPAEYKKAEWLFYTASQTINTVGWPVSIGEAQAAGVGVLMRNIRPDLRTYVGDAGFLYDSIDEATRILRGSFPEDMRERGFELAEQWDVNKHIHVLTDLWRAVCRDAA